MHYISVQCFVDFESVNLKGPQAEKLDSNMQCFLTWRILIFLLLGLGYIRQIDPPPPLPSQIVHALLSLSLLFYFLFLVGCFFITCLLR